MSDVVVVESPAKAKTINRYLGGGYTVLASFGHVRDLPPKDGSVRPDQDFAMDWESDARGEKQVGAIVKALKGAKNLYLATDPDREGEAISWHVRAMLEDKKALKGVKVQRISFNEITRGAIREAIQHPRDLDLPLIEAYMARRALDYLVGFTLSPVLWRKLPGSRSAGRVQSVALRLICEREAEIESLPGARILDHRGSVHHPRRRSVHRPADPSERQAAGPVRPQHPGAGRGGEGAGRTGRVLRRLGRAQAGPPQSATAVHDLDPAAGGISQAGIRRAANHAVRATALRRRRHRRRNHRPDHLYADRRRADGAGGDQRDPRPCQPRVRCEIPAGCAARIHQPRQERPGGARGDPSDRCSPQAGRYRWHPEQRSAPAVRTDLETRRRLADAVGGNRSGRRRCH